MSSGVIAVLLTLHQPDVVLVSDPTIQLLFVL
jgi:hypothetical protein